MSAVLKMNETHLVRYETMVTAIAECHRVDEAKDIRDKARALEVYAKQAKNTDAERKASEIRLRAERRTGELLRELARAPEPGSGIPGPGRGNKNVSNDATGFESTLSPYAEALEQSGLSRQTAHRYQQLAAVPEEDFEDALREPEKRKPTTTSIIREARAPSPQINESALWLWGRARDFERDGYADKSPADLFNLMTPTMQDDMRRIVPALVDFYAALLEQVK